MRPRFGTTFTYGADLCFHMTKYRHAASTVCPYHPPFCVPILNLSGVYALQKKNNKTNEKYHFNDKRVPLLLLLKHHKVDDDDGGRKPIFIKIQICLHWIEATIWTRRTGCFVSYRFTLLPPLGRVHVRLRENVFAGNRNHTKNGRKTIHPSKRVQLTG